MKKPPFFHSGGLPARWDPLDRVFSHKRWFGSARPQNLPKEGLNRPRRPVENQLFTLRCGAYSSAVGNGYIRGTRFHPDWQAIPIERIQGRPVDGYGSEPHAVMKSLAKVGSLPYAEANVHLETDGAAPTTQPSSYPRDAEEVAQRNRVTAYLNVDDAYDYFDDIRYALYRAYDPVTKTGPVVHAFGRWFQHWNNPPQGIIPTDTNAPYAWHAYLFIDWCVIDGVEYLVAQNTYGEYVGYGGFFFFSREIINREFALWHTALKIPTGALTEDMIAEAKKQTQLGALVRSFLLLCDAVMMKFGIGI